MVVTIIHLAILIRYSNLLSRSIRQLLPRRGTTRHPPARVPAARAREAGRPREQQGRRGEALPDSAGGTVPVRAVPSLPVRVGRVGWVLDGGGLGMRACEGVCGERDVCHVSEGCQGTEMVLGEIWRGQGWEEVGCYPGGLVRLKREWYDGRLVMLMLDRRC